MKRLDSLEASYRCCWWGFWLFIALLIVGWLTSCTTTKVTENAHSLYKSDSTQIQRLIDTRIRSIQQQMDSVWSERMNQYVSQQQQSEQQHEVITETVTTTLDSLGREIRQEQRTISRDISREQQIIEQRLTREFESRLQTAISELDSSWQSRYDSIQAVTVREDSISVKKTPVNGSGLSWWQQARIHLANILLYGLVIVGIIMLGKWHLKKLKP